MPKPRAGESKKDYISRFMSSAEAQSDFPDEKQRLAVAYSMFEKRNSALPYGQEHPWPKSYKCSFIEPGVVFYQDLGPCKVCGDKMACAQCEPSGATVLVKQEALAKMAQSFVGKPVIDKVHEDVQANTVADGEADGIVTRVWLDAESGWWMADFLVWSPEAQKHCESPSYSVSCAYEPTDVDSSGGEYHNIPYSEDIKDGVYTHLALVTNPRYEAARIYVNSKGGSMSWRFWAKGARKNAAPLDPLKAMVDVDGKKVPLKNLYDAHKEEAKNKKEEPELNDETVLDNDGMEATLGEMKASYRNREKANAELKCEACGQDKPKMNAEAGHGEHREGEPEKLPDLRHSEENPDAAESAAKKFDEGTKEKRPLELEQKKNSEENPDQAEAAAKKNAADAEAKKAEDEKKNAADAEAKKEEEKKNAAEAEEKKKEELANAKERGRKSFAALRNAREELAGDAVKISPVSIDERLAKGKSKYGSPA